MVKLIDFFSIGGGDGCIELDYADVVRLGLGPCGGDPVFDWIITTNTGILLEKFKVDSKASQI